ncbi:MAG: tRNA (adenosine(37)-N6)-threonylcarbamoyltransferase complex dimerization subunit type 1 TsaB [Armatimonadia bacterium]
MQVLGLETSEYVSSIALLRDGEVAGEQSFPSRMNLCETLTARIQELLGVERACEAELDALAVSQGPGSFTGLRVGVATAKALAHVCRLPLVGVPTQEVLAAGAPFEVGERLCVLQKARQGHVYAGLWEKTRQGAHEVRPLQVLPLTELPSYLDGEPLPLIGPGADEAADLLDQLAAGTVLRATFPEARFVAKLAAARLAAGAEDYLDNALSLQPLYHLASQAERQKNIDVSSPATEVKIRRGTLDDLPEVVRIENASFSSPWSEISLREELSGRPGTILLIIEWKGRVAGYAGAWVFAGEAHVCTIAVDPELRGHGLGELLLLSLLHQALEMRVEYAVLEYRVSNTPAAKLYEKLGFTYVHLRKRYYQDNDEDAIVAALADLGTPERQRYLRELLESWPTRRNSKVSYEF